MISPRVAEVACLLGKDEPPAFALLRPGAQSRFVVICDHASRRIPRVLGTLGLSDSELAMHIAWDIGAAEVARRVAEALDAPLVLQNYSRLVIDCNRPLEAADSVATKSEAVHIIANEGLSPAVRKQRVDEIFAPYHAAIAALLDRRASAQQQTIFIAMHSFTPVYHGVARPWHVGLLHRRSLGFAAVLLEELRKEPGLTVGDNEPYAMSDESDYTLPAHAERRSLANVGIEIRQDLIADEAGQSRWAERMARVFRAAAGKLDE